MSRRWHALSWRASSSCSSASQVRCVGGWSHIKLLHCQLLQGLLCTAKPIIYSPRTVVNC
jgi:hypothetical protein